jgi:hypothetical protein
MEFPIRYRRGMSCLAASVSCEGRHRFITAPHQSRHRRLLAVMTALRRRSVMPVRRNGGGWDTAAITGRSRAPEYRAFEDAARRASLMSLSDPAARGARWRRGGRGSAVCPPVGPTRSAASSCPALGEDGGSFLTGLQQQRGDEFVAGLGVAGDSEVRFEIGSGPSVDHRSHLLRGGGTPPDRDSCNGIPPLGGTPRLCWYEAARAARRGTPGYPNWPGW